MSTCYDDDDAVGQGYNIFGLLDLFASVFAREKG